MLQKKQLNHTHRLKKKKYLNGTKIYFCTLPECFFRLEYDMMIGKETICNICGDAFIITEATIKLDRPHCVDCGRRAVKDPVTGKKVYVNIRKSKPLASMGESVVDNLKERLASVTTYKADADTEKDIL